MRWDAEPHYRWWAVHMDLQHATQRADTAETVVSKLSWQRRKLEARLEKAQKKLRRRGVTPAGASAYRRPIVTSWRG